ncbi:MAG TPA: hypothetical protein VGJ39_09340 [Vicinamibacterales bacterium]
MAIVVLLGVVLGVPAVRDPILRAVGRTLVVDEPIEPADVIVVPEWAGAGAPIDAADLVHRGMAGRVAVLAELPEPAEEELTHRGIPYEDRAADLIQLLRRLGVPDVERIPTPAGGTDAEAQVLSEWSEQHQYRSVIVLSTPDHSRRVRRVLRRELRGHPTKAMIRSARYSSFDPDDWWQTRENLRLGIGELQKLLFDFVRHPIS